MQILEQSWVSPKAEVLVPGGGNSMVTLVRKTSLTGSRAGDGPKDTKLPSLNPRLLITNVTCRIRLFWS